MLAGVHSPFAEAFERAAATRPECVTETNLTVAGGTVAVRVVGEELARILVRSLAPGPAGGREPDLRLDLWDEQASGVGPPARARGEEIGERWGAAGERFAPSADGLQVRFSGPDFDIRLDRPAAHALGWTRSWALLSSWHRARPLQTLFMPWLTDRGMVAVHGAMVARRGEGVLLAGASGRGKSTVAAAAANGGLQVLGDDAIAVERVGAGGFAGHCLHASVKLRGEALARHPELAAHAESCGEPWEGERVVFLNEARPEQVTASARVAAVAFPRLGDRPASRFAPLSPSRALGALTGCMLSVEPGRVASAFALVTAAVERVPAYEFEVGTDTARIPAGLEALLDHVSGG